MYMYDCLLISISRCINHLDISSRYLIPGTIDNDISMLNRNEEWRHTILGQGK